RPLGGRAVCRVRRQSGTSARATGRNRRDVGGNGGRHHALLPSGRGAGGGAGRTDARGRLDRAARRRAHAVPLSAAVAAGTRGGVARGRATGGGPRATPSATHRLRVVGLRGRAAVSGVVVSPS